MVLKLAACSRSFVSRHSAKKSRLRSSKRLLKRILSSGVDLANGVDTTIQTEDLSSNFDGIRSSSDSLPSGLITPESIDY